MLPVTSLVHPELFIEQRSATTLSEVFLSAVATCPAAGQVFLEYSVSGS